MPSASSLVLLLAVAVGAAIYLLDKFSPLMGVFPLFHVGAPYGFNFHDIPDLAGKTIVVTGANSGLGFGTAKRLAMANATVVMTCRSMEKCEDAKRKILADPSFQSLPGYKTADSRIVPMVAELSSLKSVKAFTREYRKSGRPIHSLILNAGIMFPPHELTEDGIESQFGVNHVAHFALTKDLLDIVVKSQPSTIVPVASIGHFLAPPFGFHHDLESLNSPKNYEPHDYYGQSKLANVLFGKELARRLAKENVYVNVIHPGGVRGGLTKHMVQRMGGGIMQRIDDEFQRYGYYDEETGALTSLAAAVDPKIFKNNVRGEYFCPVGRIGWCSSKGSNETLARELWEFSEQILRDKGWERM